MTPAWLSVQTSHEQDEAGALDWWNRSTEEERTLMWKMIQSCGEVYTKLSGDSVRVDRRELLNLAKFAQIGFRHVALLAEGKKS